MVMLERRDAVNRAIERFIEDGSATTGYSRWRTAESEDGRGSLLAERPWLASYEADVPPTIDIPRLPLNRLLDRAWRRFPRRPALIYKGRTLSYRNLSAQAARLANALRALGCVKGTRVMLLAAQCAPGGHRFLRRSAARGGGGDGQSAGQPRGDYPRGAAFRGRGVGDADEVSGNGRYRQSAKSSPPHHLRQCQGIFALVEGGAVCTAAGAKRRASA